MAIAARAIAALPICQPPRPDATGFSRLASRLEQIMDIWTELWAGDPA